MVIGVLDIHPLFWDLSWFEKDTEQVSTLECGCRVRPPQSVSGFWILGYWGDMSEIFGQTWLSMMHPMTLPGDICRDPRVERLLGKYRRRNSPTEAYCFCLVSTTYLLKIRPWPTIIRTVLLNFFFVTRKAYPSPRRGKDSHTPLIGLITHFTRTSNFPCLLTSWSLEEGVNKQWMRTILPVIAISCQEYIWCLLMTVILEWPQND